MSIWMGRGLMAVMLGCTVAGWAAERVLFREDFEAGLRAIWQPVEFEGETAHTIMKEGTNRFLQAAAASSASGLAVKLGGVPAEGAQISWRWKIDRTPAGGSDDVLKTFDHTARVFVAFRTFVGPPRSINYIWGNVAKPGQTLHHPSSGRSRLIVLQSGNLRAGEWVTESRDLANDWKLLFGGDDAPDVVGLGIMTDSDGTETTVTGSYDDLVLSARP